MELPYIIAAVIAVCIFIIALGFTWSIVSGLKHAIATQANELDSVLKKYADVRSIAYRTEHSVQDMKRVETFLVDRVVKIQKEVDALSGDLRNYLTTKNETQ